MHLAGEMVQWVKHWPQKLEDLSLNPQRPLAAGRDGWHLWSQSYSCELEEQENPWELWSANLTYSGVSNRETPSQTMGKVGTNTQGCFLTSKCMPWHLWTHTHIHVHMLYNHRYTHKIKKWSVWKTYNMTTKQLPTEWESIFNNSISDRRVIFKIYKELN